MHRNRRGFSRWLYCALLAPLLFLACFLLFIVFRSPSAAPNRAPLIFTYETGDMIGGFARKIAAALSAQGVPVRVVANHPQPSYFWHSGYRPNAFTPVIAPNQSVYYNLENVRIDPKPNAETVLQTRHLEPGQGLNGQRLLHVPWAWVAFEERYSIPHPTALLRGSAFNARAVMKRKTRFCSFMASYCNYEREYLQIYGAHMDGIKQERTKFYELLNATYKPVDALGRCYHNTEQPPKPKLRAGERWSVHDQSIYMMRPYKFAMCMENAATPGYFTEKLFNAYLAETIPIYWGDPRVNELVNTEAFIWCRPAEPWSRCLEQVKEVDTNDELYLRMLRAPILKGNVIPDWMNYGVLASKLDCLWGLSERSTQ